MGVLEKRPIMTIPTNRRMRPTYTRLRLNVLSSLRLRLRLYTFPAPLRCMIPETVLSAVPLVAGLLVGFIYPAADMLSTYSFMAPWRALGEEPKSMERNPAVRMLVGRLGVEGGLLLYFTVESAAFVSLFALPATVLPSSSSPGLFVLLPFEAVVMYRGVRTFRSNLRSGKRLRAAARARMRYDRIVAL